MSTIQAEVEAYLQVIGSDPPPMLLVVKVHGYVTAKERDRLAKEVSDALEGKPHPPIIVVDEEISIEAVSDPRARRKKKVCAHCECEYRPKSKRIGRFCSAACRTAAYRTRKNGDLVVRVVDPLPALGSPWPGLESKT